MKEVIKLHEVIRVDPNPVSLRSLEEETRGVSAQMKHPVRTQPEGSRLQANDGGFKKSKPAYTWVLNFLPATRPVRK